MSDVKGSTRSAATFATVFEAYRPVERYLQHLEIDQEHVRASIAPLDAFLMQQIAAYFPKPPVIVDLAADATHGASAVFWANQPHILAVVVPSTPSDATCGWRPLVREALKDRHTDCGQVIFADKEHTDLAAWKRLLPAIHQNAPVLIILDVNDVNVAQIPCDLRDIFDEEPDASILVFPLGPIGNCRALAQLVPLCGPDSPFRLTAMREMSPFFSMSQLGIIGDANHPFLSSVIQRLRQLFDGNFQFLSMVNTVIKASTHEKNREALIHRQETQMLKQADILRKREEHIAWLDSRLRHLEEEYVPWKNKYIENLETHLRNLSGSKALKLSNALRHVLGRFR